MGFFSKKEEVPKIQVSKPLPELPSLPPLEPEKKSLPELPSFPSNPKAETLNQEMVKSAVSDIPSPEEEEVIPAPPIKQINMEHEEGALPKLPHIPKPEPVQSSYEKPIEVPEKPMTHSQQKATEPIFVRIDKFQSAQKNFDEIKSKTAEIEKILKKIKDVKMQEEEELKKWTEDIEKLKNQLAEIDSNIFNQL